MWNVPFQDEMNSSFPYTLSSLIADMPEIETDLSISTIVDSANMTELAALMVRLWILEKQR